MLVLTGVQNFSQKADNCKANLQGLLGVLPVSCSLSSWKGHLCALCPSGPRPSCECMSLLPSQILLGFERLQAITRSHLLVRQYQAIRQRIVQLQALCRGYLVRLEVQAKRRAVLVIQAHARGMAARQNFRRQKANVGGHCSPEQ